MRPTLLMFLLLSLVTLAPAQEQTLLIGEIEHGGYGAPVVKFTEIKGDLAVLVGGQGAWIINHTLALGGGGFGLVTEHPATYIPVNSPLPYRRDYELGMGYGGAILSYIGLSDALFHPTVDLLIGGGLLTPTDFDRDYDHDDDVEDHDSFFVVEPGVNMEMNITSFLRINLGGSFRVVNGVRKFGYDDEDLSGFSGNLIVKFGKF